MLTIQELTENELSVMTVFARSTHPDYVVASRMRWSNELHPIYIHGDVEALHAKLEAVRASELEDVVTVFKFPGAGGRLAEIAEPREVFRKAG